MLFKSQVLTEASGSIGGMTYSHNAGGMYTRGRTIPVNPNSQYQQGVRGALAALATAWTSELTDAQRLAWQVFADNVPVVNRLGDARVIPALAWYIKANVQRLAQGKTRIDAGPEVYALGNLTEPSPTVQEPSTGSLAFTNSDAWAIAVGGHLFLQVSPPQSPTVNFYSGPFRTVLTVNGAVVPPTTPQAFTYPWAGAEGQKVFYRTIASEPDGRPTNVWSGSFLVGS